MFLLLCCHSNTHIPPHQITRESESYIFSLLCIHSLLNSLSERNTHQREIPTFPAATFSFPSSTCTCGLCYIERPRTTRRDIGLVHLLVFHSGKRSAGLGDNAGVGLLSPHWLGRSEISVQLYFIPAEEGEDVVAGDLGLREDVKFSLV